MSAIVRLGSQGWAYADWIGAFYPPGSKQQHYLPFYAEVFDTVEIDATFYGPPSASVVRSWARHTPAHFRFAAKLPSAITHEAMLAGAGDLLASFVAALEPLGEKLGPLLVQLPAEFEREPARVADLERFLASAPPGVRLAVEFRHVSWHAEGTAELLRRHGAALAWTEWRTLPRVPEVTTDFLYCRWIGDRRDIEVFDRVQIDRDASFAAWADDLVRVLPEVREVYGYFNNHWAGHSPASANEMKRRLGLVPVEPRSRWNQGELW